MPDLHLLGKFEVEADGEPIEITSRPAQALLAYLALHPEVAHRREKLAGSLWPESTESNARGNLRQALWQLRKSIGDEVIEADKATIALARARPLGVDVHRLERGAEDAATVEEWTDWAGLYQGELLPGWYEDWAVRQRERLEALFQRHMPDALGAMVEAGRWNAVLKWAEHWISLGHAPEPAYRSLMTAHAALGDAAALAATFERCVQALESELGVEPSPETVSHYEALAAGERPAAAAVGAERDRIKPHHNLPAQATAFIGREREIRQVKQLLESPDHRLITVTGPGGTGKTRLAFEVVKRLAPDFVDGARFVDLSPLVEPAMIPSAIAAVLAVKEQGDRSALEELKDHLAGREALLLLDNFEHLVEGAPVVGDLLAAAPGLKCLVTSREPLRVYGERELHLVPLSVPQAEAESPEEMLESSEAVRLFQDRAKALDPNFKLTDDNSTPVSQICRRVDGLPLAIELAAARVRMFPPEALLDRLEDRLGTLTGGPRDAPARQQTLRNTLEWSHSLLDSSQKVLFARLGVFTGGCNLEALRAVCRDESGEVIVDDVQSLITKSLIYQEQGPHGEPRYRMLETIREFALERLEADGTAYEIEQRHAHHFAGFAEEADSHLEGPDAKRWIERLEADHDNLRTAVGWSLDQVNEPELGLRFAGSMARFWVMRGYLSEGYASVTSALEWAGGDAGARLGARAVLGAARLAYRQNNLEAANTHYSEALDLARQLEEPAWTAECLIGLGMVDTERGNYAAVEDKFEEALSLFRELGDISGEANAITNLAWAAMRTGDYDTAEAHLQDSLDLTRQAGDRSGVGFNLSGLGEVSVRMGDLERASEYLQESLEVRSSLGDKWGMGATLGTLGWVAIRQEDWGKATRHLLESFALRKELVDKGGMAWCLEKLAEVSLVSDRHHEAVSLYGAAHSIRESIGSSIDPADQELYERNLAYLREALGGADFESAWAHGAKRQISIVEGLQMDLSDGG